MTTPEGAVGIGRKGSELAVLCFRNILFLHGQGNDTANQQYTAEKRDIDHLDYFVCFFTHRLKTEVNKRVITLAHQLGHTNKQQQHIDTNGQTIIPGNPAGFFAHPGHHLMIDRHT